METIETLNVFEHKAEVVGRTRHIDRESKSESIARIACKSELVPTRLFVLRSSSVYLSALQWSELLFI